MACPVDDVFACFDGSVTIGVMNQEAKQSVRQEFFAARKALSPTERDRQSQIICETLLHWYAKLSAQARSAGKVAMTIQFGTEPDTDPVMHALHADGVDVWVPISHADRSLSWVRWTPQVAMERSSLGPIMEPVGQRFGPEQVADADLIVVPALAADTAGFRMGKGGGYYDRFLAQLPDLVESVPPLITPVFDHELFAPQDRAFPVDAHDLPVQAVLTAATGLRWVGGPHR